jgi:hypothetical protein
MGVSRSLRSLLDPQLVRGTGSWLSIGRTVTIHGGSIFGHVAQMAMLPLVLTYSDPLDEKADDLLATDPLDTPKPGDREVFGETSQQSAASRSAGRRPSIP